MKAPHDAGLEAPAGQRAALRWGAASLAAVIVFSLLVPAIILWRDTPGHSLVGAPQAVSLPPEPRLQTDPGTDRRAYLRRQAAKADRAARRDDGYARIPLKEAIDIMAERGGWRRDGGTP